MGTASHPLQRASDEELIAELIRRDHRCTVSLFDSLWVRAAPGSSTTPTAFVVGGDETTRDGPWEQRAGEPIAAAALFVRARHDGQWGFDYEGRSEPRFVAPAVPAAAGLLAEAADVDLVAALVTRVAGYWISRLGGPYLRSIDCATPEEAGALPDRFAFAVGSHAAEGPWEHVVAAPTPAAAQFLAARDRCDFA